jgi:perosamine synthetase
MMEGDLNVPIARTSLSEEEINSVLEPLRSGWLVQGPRVAEFEAKWSEFTGAAHSVAVTSCTTALHLSLAALGFGPGDEAIVPAFTWISTANVVEHLGGRVVFCDIDPITFNIDVTKLESLITPRTTAILPVHLFGLAASMREIKEIAQRHNLRIVEDAACGFGSIYEGQHVGTLGDTGCFSFHPRKAITTGEGGMITTANGELAASLRQLRDHGAAMSDLQRHHGPRPYLLADHPVAGYNQRMTDIQGALGASQMTRAHEILAERRRIAAIYDEALADLDWLRTPTTPAQNVHGYQSYPCSYAGEEVTAAIEARDLSELLRISELRNSWMQRLHERGVATRPATHSVHTLSYYSQKYSLAPMDFPAAFAAGACSVSLPLFHGITDAEIEHVIASVREA